MNKYTGKCTALVDFLKTEIKLMNRENTGHLDEPIAMYNSWVRHISNGVKFMLPDNGQLFELNQEIFHFKDYLTRFMDKVNLPYPVVCLEYSVVSNRNADFILLLCDIGDKILVKPFVYLDSGTFWIPECHAELVKETFELRFRFNQQSDLASYTQQIAEQFMIIVAQFLSALSCSNTSIVDDPTKPSKTKQAIRQSKKQLPFFSYKLLTINTAKQVPSSTASNNGSDPQHTKRAHLRRGHIRRLKDKNVWVNACAVGSKSNGEISKDYRVI